MIVFGAMSSDSYTELTKRLTKRLAGRSDNGSLRSLVVKEGLVDFCSNDYLGFARRSFESSALTNIPNGSTGSRLLTGNSPAYEALEEHLASFHSMEAALIFTSGYAANLALLSSIAERDDFILFDEAIHASLRDGARLSFARSRSFKHNDLNDLESRIKSIRCGTLFVVVESVYSMDGDLAPLTEIVSLCKQHGAFLIVDEAHAVGVFGERGEGRVGELKLTKEVGALVVTFGKAVGVHGAAVLGSKTLCDYLLNFARPFIYTTALPPHTISAINQAYEALKIAQNERAELWSLISQFEKRAVLPREVLSPNPSPIQSLKVPGNEEVKRLSEALRLQGLDVRPILSPTVPKGGERLRISLHAFNSVEELITLFNAIDECTSHGGILSSAS